TSKPDRILLSFTAPSAFLFSSILFLFSSALPPVLTLSAADFFSFCYWVSPVKTLGFRRHDMKRLVYVSFGILILAGAASAAAQGWPQWGRNAQHTGTTSVTGQTATHILENIVYDPFVAQEKADPLAAPDLLVHYQTPLVDGNNVYMEFKSGTYTSLDHWETQTWNERRLQWQGGHLNTVWSFQSDWKPVPYGSATNGPGWEPVFHAALSGNSVYVPGAGGSIFK